MALVDEIKLSMRIQHNVLDADIDNNILACKSDMVRVGVNIEPNTDYSTADLIGKSCELFCKAEYNYMNKGEQYKKNYEALRDSLSLVAEEQNV